MKKGRNSFIQLNIYVKIDVNSYLLYLYVVFCCGYYCKIVTCVCKLSINFLVYHKFVVLPAKNNYAICYLSPVNIRTIAHLFGGVITIAWWTQRWRYVILVCCVRRLLVLGGFWNAWAPVISQVVSRITAAYNSFSVVSANLLTRMGWLTSVRTKILSHKS